MDSNLPWTILNIIFRPLCIVDFPIHRRHTDKHLSSIDLMIEKVGIIFHIIGKYEHSSHSESLVEKQYIEKGKKII